jgi:hypothetical protein
MLHAVRGIGGGFEFDAAVRLKGIGGGFIAAVRGSKLGSDATLRCG